MNNNRSLQLNLSLDELSEIMNALGKQPYQQVFQLVNKIQAQSQAQLQSEQNNDAVVEELSEPGESE